MEKVEELQAKDIAENPSEYIGKYVPNYSSGGMSNWSVFYADENGVYLISDQYIENVPYVSVSGGDVFEPVSKGDVYPCGFRFDNYDDLDAYYSGSNAITDERIRNLNKSYFSQNFESSERSWKVVAYMLDKEIWHRYVDSEFAEYAIGGPTIEMFYKSYCQRHNLYMEIDGAKIDKLQAFAVNNFGYLISIDGGDSAQALSEIPEVDELYVNSRQDEAYGVWLASAGSADNGTSFVCYLTCEGTVNHGADGENGFMGFKPVVCLKSDVRFRETEDGWLELL